MSHHTAGTRKARRSRLRLVFFIGVLVAALGIASPAVALLGITLPIPSAGNPTTTVTLHVEDNSGTDVTPNTSLNLAGENATGIGGILDLAGGLTQTGTTLTQLLNGLKAGAAVAAPGVQATATDAVATAITNLQARAAATAAEALALDPNTVTDATAGIVSDLQGQATSEVAGLLPLALTSGLQVVQNIVSPVCSLTAIPASFLPGLGVDTTRLYTAVAPVIQQADLYTNQVLRDTYSNVYDDVLASVNSIPTAGPILSALLLLLKYNWTTSYTPPGSSTPVVTTTKALMNVPTPIDVDHDGIFDLCGTTSFALAGGGTSISGIKLTQTITKMPLAKPVLPVDIDGGLLNVINVGYNTSESSVPIVYTSSATLDTSTGSRLAYDGTYAVNRGSNLTIPPASLNALALAPNVVLPTFPALVTPAPKPIVTQKFCIGGCSAIMGAYRHENVPTATHVDTPLASVSAIDVNYTGAQTDDSFGYKFSVGAPSSNIGVSTVLGADRPAVGTTPARVFSAPTAARSCFGPVTCSPNALTGDTNVVGFTASSPTSLDQDVLLATANTPNVCTGVGALNQVTHLNDTSQFYTGAKKGASGAGTGHLAIDTGGKPMDGCTGLGSLGALSGGTQLTLPPGFTADNRAATYHQSGLSQPVPDTKTGTATCPSGTVADYSLVIATAHLQPVICPTPVTAGTVTINGSPVVDNTITAAVSGWGPPAPNAPTFTYQWNKCAADGTGCQPIPGATSSSYTLQYGPEGSPPPTDPASDYHHKFTVTVKGTNLDSNASVTSAPTVLVELPPPPVNTVLPTLGANRKVGVATTLASVGTWNPGATAYLYRWQSCVTATLLCSDIAGATGTSTNAAGVSYTLTSAEKGRYLRVGVTGKNHGGTSAEVFTATGYVPGDPVNNTPPGIKNGPANAVGGAVATGDNLAATPGTWTDTNAAFTYEWQRCDSSGNDCHAIAGATGVGYTVNHPDDDGHTLRVAVGGHGLNGDTVATSGATGVVIFNDLSAKPAKDVVDGTVNATVASDHGTSYVGGSFDTAGPSVTGGGKVVGGGSSTGKNVDHQAQVRGGVVKAVAADGNGGYFLAGSFDHVAGAPDACPGIAHIQSNGSLDPTYCQSGLTGTVNAVNYANGVLTIGGSFALGSHNNLAFVDGGGQAVYNSDGDPNGAVNAIADDSVESGGNHVYVGGDFTAIGSGATYTSNHLAAYTVSTAGGLSVARPVYAMSVTCAGTTNGCVNAGSATVLTMTYVRSHYPGAFFGSTQLVAPSDIPTLLIG
ncbi:MAG: hypothetical protein ACJ72D_19255, partial [Marmoricola sp.]